MREFRIVGWAGLVAQWPHIKELIRGLFDSGKKELLVTVQDKRRNTLTSAKIHAMIGDIRNQCVIKVGVHTLDKSRDLEVWKSLLVRWFDLEMTELGEPLARGGKRIFDMMYGEWVYMRPSTVDFSQSEAGKFIEWLYCFGTERGVVWSEKALECYNEYKELKNG